MHLFGGLLGFGFPFNALNPSNMFNLGPHLLLNPSNMFNIGLHLLLNPSNMFNLGSHLLGLLGLKLHFNALNPLL